MKYLIYLGNSYQFDIDKKYIEVTYSTFKNANIHFTIDIYEDDIFEYILVSTIYFTDETLFFDYMKRYLNNPNLEPIVKFNYILNGVIYPIYIAGYSQWLEQLNKLGYVIAKTENTHFIYLREYIKLINRAYILIWQEIICQMNNENCKMIYNKWFGENND